MLDSKNYKIIKIIYKNNIDILYPFLPDWKEWYQGLQKTKMLLKCNKCNYIFWKKMNDFIHNTSSFCPVCGSPRKLDYLTFRAKAIRVHGVKYNYDLITEQWWQENYTKNQETKVPIKCNRHGIFYQTVFNHLRGNGCSKCHESHGEREVRKLLDKNNIDYIYQWRQVINKHQYFFDFYLEKFNTVIEYNGKQHYPELINKNAFGSSDYREVEKTLIRDRIKREWCEENNIKMLVIRFDENIEQKLIEGGILEKDS